MTMLGIRISVYAYLSLLFLIQTNSFGVYFLNKNKISIAHSLFSKLALSTNSINDDSTRPTLQPPTFEDMKTMAVILSNITDYIDTQPGNAMKVVTDNMGWLYSRNVPKLTQMLLTDYPELREDTIMMRSYMFLIDFLEAVTKETSNLLKRNQNLLKSVLEAAKVSESKLNEVISKDSTNYISPEFMLYLDTEIENQEVNSQFQSLLVTIKLRLLDEWGKTKGVDVMMLPKIASEEDPNIMRQKTIQIISDYNNEGRELFLTALQILRKEMIKRYQNVDPILIANLEEIEKITKSFIKESQR